nr:50S ribosomal protein L13 [Methanothermus fervidus]
MYIDGEGHILGRLASIVSKKLLEGEKVTVFNTEKIIITGSRDWILERYQQRVRRSSLTNPRRMGPKYPRRPDDIFRRTVRGMLPYKKPKGRKAFKNLRAYVGIPREFKDVETIKIKEAMRERIKKGITLGEVSRHLGARF